MKIKLAKYISEFLVQKGVTDCFMVTGGGAMHLNDAFGHQEGLKVTFNHNEQGSSVAAEGYARLTGKIALVSVTSGPGGTNAITGVYGGYVDSIPMFVVSGQVKRETTIHACPELGLRQLGDQEIDIISLVKPVTKYAEFVDEPNDIAWHLEKAWYLANEGRKGPVWLDVPLDVQGATIETDELRHFDPEEEEKAEKTEGVLENGTKILKNLTDSDYKEILEKVQKASSPLILVGTGVRIAGAEAELLELLKKMQLPVVTAWNANDLVAFENPCFAGMPGTVGTRPGNFAIQNADLLISLGCRLNIRMIGYNHFDFAKNAYKIIVDIDEKELKKPTICPDLPVCEDVKTFMKGLLRQEYTPAAQHKKWLGWCREMVEKYPVVLDSYHKTGDEEVNPYVFIDKLFAHFTDQEKIICGNGSACVITFQAGKIRQGQRMFTNSGCAAMGYGLPAALGVAIADRDSRTICLDGDGSVMMNIQELATIGYNRLNMKIIIINNNGYHSIRQTQRNLFKGQFVGIDTETGIGFPDFGMLAAAFGLKYYTFKTEQEMDGVLDEALNAEGPVLIEAVVDPNQNFEPKSSSKILPDGRITSPSLDDMFPFMEVEKYVKE